MATPKRLRNPALLAATPWLCAWLIACGSDAPSLDAPDLQWLADAYDSPDAELEPERVRDAVQRVLPLLGVLRTGDGFPFLLSRVHSVQDGFVARGLTRELEADIDGRATVRVICPGFEHDREPDAERDGSIELNLPIDDAALGPVAFGPARACRFDEAPEAALPAWLPELPRPLHAVLDGELAIHFGQPLVLGRQTALKPLIRIDGTLAVEGFGELRDFDFRLSEQGVLETRLAGDAGETAVLVLEGEAISLRERRGSWTCATDTGVTCLPEF